MSDVKRYGHISYLVEATPKIVQLYPEMTIYVLAEDYNAAQSELSALREENERLKSESFEELYNAAIDERDALREELALANKLLATHERQLDRMIEHSDDLQQRLTAAEQRNADQLAMLHMAKELLSTISLHKTMAPADWCESFKNEVADRLEKLRAALKPTESGASEQKCCDRFPKCVCYEGADGL